MKFFATIAAVSSLTLQPQPVAYIQTELAAEIKAHEDFLCDTSSNEVWSQFNTNKDACLSWGEITTALKGAGLNDK